IEELTRTASRCPVTATPAPPSDKRRVVATVSPTDDRSGAPDGLRSWLPGGGRRRHSSGGGLWPVRRESKRRETGTPGRRPSAGCWSPRPLWHGAAWRCRHRLDDHGRAPFAPRAGPAPGPRLPAGPSLGGILDAHVIVEHRIHLGREQVPL